MECADTVYFADPNTGTHMKVLSLTLVFALLGLELAAAAPQSALRTADYQDTIRIACVGDSITFGAGVENREVNNYPVVLGKLLGEKFQTRNFGVSGATLLQQGDLPYWKLSAFKDATDYQPHAVVIKLGTNDSKPQNWKHKEDFANDLRALIDHFRALPTHPKIWVCLPVPVYEEKWGINEPVVKGEVIPLIKQVAKETGVPTIDLYSALSNHAEMFPDKIHPNAAGAAFMTKTIPAALLGK